MKDAPRKHILVTFDDGDTVETEINGTEAVIKAYYIGKSFTKHDDTTHRAIAVQFIA